MNSLFFLVAICLIFISTAATVQAERIALAPLPFIWT